MKQEDVTLAYECAKLYYRRGSSQEEVAVALGISRPKVSRLLALAQKLGIVTITVRPPDIFDQTRLEQRLSAQYGLKRVLIGIPEDNVEPVVRRAIVSRFIESLPSFLSAKTRIGVGLGCTIYEMARALRPDGSAPADMSVTPLMGVAGQSDPAYQINTIVDLLAESFHAERKYLMTPAICESPSQKKAFLASPQVAAVVERWSSLDTAIFGLGKPIEESAVLFSSFPEKYLVQMVQRHAVGDVLARFFDAQGTMVCPDADSVSLSIPLATLLRVPERVCLAGGARKQAGIRAALKSGLVTTLITDLFTAQLLAEQEE